MSINFTENNEGSRRIISYSVIRNFLSNRLIVEFDSVVNFYNPTTNKYENKTKVIIEARILNSMPKFIGNIDQVTSQMMTFNRQWILKEMRSGRTILDIGVDINRANPSIFYQMEQNMIKNYLKLHPNSFKILN
jgi:hypothetical protein